jgi:hypothetical protein
MSGKGGGVSDLKVGRRGQLDGEALTLVCWCVVAVGGDEQGGTRGHKEVLLDGQGPLLLLLSSTCPSNQLLSNSGVRRRFGGRQVGGLWEGGFQEGCQRGRRE